MRKALRLLALRLSSVRVRLTLWYVGLLSVFLVAFGAFLYVSLSRSLHAQAASDVRLDTQRLLDRMDPRDGAPALFDAAADLPADMVAVLYDVNGAQLDTTDAHSTMPALPDAVHLAAAGKPSLQVTRAATGEEWQVLTVSLRDGAGFAEVLQVGQSERQVEAALDRLIVLMAVGIPGLLLLAVAGGLFMARRALAPVDHMTRTARRIQAEDLSQRLDVANPADEIGRLGVTLNQMLERLQHAFQRQQQFTADASHELRTPLAVISSRTELALERPRSAGEYRRALCDVLAQADRATQLLSEMLTLARADSGADELSREPVALSGLVSDVVDAMAPLGEARHVGLQLAEVQAIVVDGDQTRLAQLIVNLVDNALKYTAPGGTVRLSVCRAEGFARLAVADTGPGIPPEHLPHLFERFYRVDDARGPSGGGSGLGLSIAHWIATAHGGHIEVDSRPGAGTTFTVILPVKPLLSAAA